MVHVLLSFCFSETTEPHFYENAMNFYWIPYENCKIKFHGFIFGHEFSMKGYLPSYLMTHEFRNTRDSRALRFPWKLVTEYFMGYETMKQDFQGIEFSMNLSQSGPRNHRTRLSWSINFPWIQVKCTLWIMNSLWWYFHWIIIEVVWQYHNI